MYEREVGCVGEGDGNWFAVVMGFFATDSDSDVVFVDVGVVAGGAAGGNLFE